MSGSNGDRLMAALAEAYHRIQSELLKSHEISKTTTVSGAHMYEFAQHKWYANDLAEFGADSMVIDTIASEYLKASHPEHPDYAMWLNKQGYQLSDPGGDEDWTSNLYSELFGEAPTVPGDPSSSQPSVSEPTDGSGSRSEPPGLSTFLESAASSELLRSPAPGQSAAPGDRSSSQPPISKPTDGSGSQSQPPRRSTLLGSAASGDLREPPAPGDRSSSQPPISKPTDNSGSRSKPGRLSTLLESAASGDLLEPAASGQQPGSPAPAGDKKPDKGKEKIEDDEGDEDDEDEPDRDSDYDPKARSEARGGLVWSYERTDLAAQVLAKSEFEPGEHILSIPALSAECSCILPPKVFAKFQNDGAALARLHDRVNKRTDDLIKSFAKELDEYERLAQDDPDNHVEFGKFEQIATEMVQSWKDDAQNIAIEFFTKEYEIPAGKLKRTTKTVAKFGLTIGGIGIGAALLAISPFAPPTGVVGIVGVVRGVCSLIVQTRNALISINLLQERIQKGLAALHRSDLVGLSMKYVGVALKEISLDVLGGITNDLSNLMVTSITGLSKDVGLLREKIDALKGPVSKLSKELGNLLDSNDVSRDTVITLIDQVTKLNENIAAREGAALAIADQVRELRAIRGGSEGLGSAIQALAALGQIAAGQIHEIPQLISSSGQLISSSGRLAEIILGEAKTLPALTSSAEATARTVNAAKKKGDRKKKTS